MTEEPFDPDDYRVPHAISHARRRQKASVSGNSRKSEGFIGLLAVLHMMNDACEFGSQAMIVQRHAPTRLCEDHVIFGDGKQRHFNAIVLFFSANQVSVEVLQFQHRPMAVHFHRPELVEDWLTMLNNAKAADQAVAAHRRPNLFLYFSRCFAHPLTGQKS